MKFLVIIIFISASNYLPDLFGSDIKITATVDRTTIGINQTFTLEVELSGEGANKAGDPKLPDISDFATFMGNSGTSTNMQIINGKMSLSTTYSFTFMATKVGKFTISPVIINFNGQEYSSTPISIEVAQSTTPPPQSRQRDARTPADQPSLQNLEDNLFLHVSVNKRRVYVNEPIILAYKIYTRVTVTQYGIGKLPNTAGFWAEEFPLGNQPKTYEEILNGKKYMVAEIKRTALFPTDAGTKTIGPMEIECSIRVQQQRRSIFDSFFDDPFFGRTVNQTIASKSLNVEVLPLPDENRPKSFSGLVGQFNLSADVDKTSIKTNEAISLKIKI
ncbi:MAG: BatD family protein, partial [bacterium]|nr:BatD family protein [bacterium]